MELFLKRTASKTSEKGPDKSHPRYVCLDGKTFGSLTVLRDTSTGRILCECSCGRQIEKSKASVKSGKTTSCGKGPCHKGVKDLTGQIFGRLTAIEILVTKSNHAYGTLWKCKCKCGTMCEVVSHSLVNGITQSCGCISAKMAAEKSILPDKLAIKKQVWISYENHAKKLGVTIELTFRDGQRLMGEDCHYCGAPPSNIRSTGNKYGPSTYAYNGLDRKNPEKGYSLDNVVPCCKKCNYAKRKLGYDEFLDLASKISERHRKRADENL